MLNFIRNSIRNKLLAALLLLSLVPLAIVGFVAQQKASESLRDRAIGQLQSVAVLQRDRTLKQYTDTVRVVQDLASDPDVVARVTQIVSVDQKLGAGEATAYKEFIEVVEAAATDPWLVAQVTRFERGEGKDGEGAPAKDRAAITSELRHRTKNVAGIIDLSITDDKGVVIADTLTGARSQVGQSKATDTSFTGAREAMNKAYVKPLFRTSTGIVSLAISHPISDPAGGFRGAVVMRLNGQQLVRLFSDQLVSRMRVAVKNIPAVESVHVMDDKGIIIADTLPEGKSQTGKRKADNPYFTGAMANRGRPFWKPTYHSSLGVPTSAASVTLQDSRGRVLGVVVLRIRTDEFDRILAERTGLGETGEAYLVAPDVRDSTKVISSDPVMVTSSRFVEEAILKEKVDSYGAREALAGHSGWATYTDYRGKRVVGVYSPISELKSALLCEISEAEAFASVRTLRLIVIGAIAVVFVVVVVAALWLAGGLTKQVRKIQELFNNVAIGNLDARADVVSSDELGEMATGLNAMLDNTLTLIQSRDGRDQIQASITKLLDEVAGVGQGDLTKEAEVTADMTGAIADSFNYMIEQLRKIIGDVQEATTQVTSSASQILANAEHVATGSENQAEQIVSTSAAIDEMAVSIQQVSQNAQVATTVAKEALNTAIKGKETVGTTIEGMNRIRDQVQETAKRIKRLGESSQEIGQIIQLIDDIADRTSILALNASIQAAAAGEAGRGFAVVAAEVERLAERSTEATKKIATLVKTIQGETSEAVAAMEKGINEVVDGSKLTNQAGKALEEIQTVSNRLAELIQSISLAAHQQARGSESLAKAMSEISTITQQTATGTKEAATSVGQLTNLADSLRASVSRFKLPGRNGHGSAPSTGKSAPEFAGSRQTGGKSVPELVGSRQSASKSIPEFASTR
ncbi:MAG TPA: methyl-accepting chemotaxis protein [Gemmataceae bacterium]|nr:methyl-accepting chemotaxis protein [Gemmataceae bacterium]